MAHAIVHVMGQLRMLWRIRFLERSGKCWIRCGAEGKESFPLVLILSHATRVRQKSPYSKPSVILFSRSVGEGWTEAIISPTGFDLFPNSTPPCRPADGCPSPFGEGQYSKPSVILYIRSVGEGWTEAIISPTGFDLFPLPDWGGGQGGEVRWEGRRPDGSKRITFRIRFNPLPIGEGMPA